MQKVTKYILMDILRNRFIVAYTLVLLLITISLFVIEENPQKALLGIMNVVLFIVPLVSLIFSTIYLYNSSEFIELLLSQPIRRSGLLVKMFLGITLALLGALLIGMGIPILVYAASGVGLSLLLAGVVLTVIFAAIALLASVLTRDKARGIGVSLLLWLYFSFIFDGLVLLILFQFADYPLETPMIVFSMLNPVDIARISFLLQVDVSAMMGFTGALFQSFFGSTAGIFISISVLLAWMGLPLWLAVRKFRVRDL